MVVRTKIITLIQTIHHPDSYRDKTIHMETKKKVIITLSALAAVAAAGTGIYLATRKPSDEDVVKNAVREVAPGKEDEVKNMSSEEIKTVADAIKPLTWKDAKNADGTTTRTWSDGRVERLTVLQVKQSAAAATQGRPGAFKVDGLTGTQKDAIAILRKHGIMK